MNPKPKVTVYMTVYNEERFLDESIRSILNQTLQDFEFIIVDDGSTDGSLRILNKYAEKDKRIKILCNKQNLGQPKSLNRALRIARGEYLARMDADDISLPNRLKIQVDFLEKNKEYFLVGCGEISIDEKGSKTEIFRPICEEDCLRKKLEEKMAFSGPSFVFRSEDSNFYREKFYYAQDYDFSLISLTKGKRITNIPDLLYKWRMKSSGASYGHRGKQKLFGKMAREFYHQRLTTGTDGYDMFDPGKILNMDIHESTDKLVLTGEIKAYFRMNRFREARKFCRRYFTTNGFSIRVLKYYMLSLLGKTIVSFLRKVKFALGYPKA